MAICNQLTITHDFLLQSNSKNEPNSQRVPQSCSLDIIQRSATCLNAALGITQPRKGSLGTRLNQGRMQKKGCRTIENFAQKLEVSINQQIITFILLR